MSKKTLIVLLLLPFVLGITFFAASSFLVTKIKADISNIEWKYKNNEVYSMEEKQIPLEATPILADHQEDADATLLWSVKNADNTSEPYAKVISKNGKPYLEFITVGSVVVTCTNSNGNISKSFTAKIYQGGVVSINTARARSFDSIEKRDYYGVFDFEGSGRKNATFYLDVVIQPSNLIDSLTIETSPNVDYNYRTKKVTILSGGDAYIKYVSADKDYCSDEIYEFTCVTAGYNVYSYSDLLKCTNKDSQGKIVCLQTNLDSLSNTYNIENGKLVKKDEITSLFGTYNESTKKFNFKNEVYKFESTYNTEFIDQYNAQNSTSFKKELIAGVHIQKDFYGNGYLINAHNLTYPTGQMSTEEYIVALGTDDLFRGPLPFVIIGNYTTPVVESYGQDNVGFYVDGNNITLRDVNFANCTYSNVLQNNDYTGTVVELNGDNISVINSHLSSGKTVLRSYSNKNTLIKNCLLEKGREFILKTGTNEYEKIDEDQMVEFDAFDWHYSYNLREFLAGETEININNAAEALLNLHGEYDRDTIMLAKNVIQDILNRSIIDMDDPNSFKNDITIEDTFFYQSGIFSIALDTMFNGPYLYNGAPVKEILGDMLEGNVMPNNIGGVGYPSKINISGDTRFYDYKVADQVELSCLVYQNISDMLKELGKADTEVTLDDFFPVKPMIEKYSNKLGYTQTLDNTEYINTPFATFGGGHNGSIINTTNLNTNSSIDKEIYLDIYNEVNDNNNLQLSDNPTLNRYFSALSKCVSMAIGFEPFRLFMYNDGLYFNQNVSVDVLRDRSSI